MQGSKLYVGNLNYAVTADELTELFSAYGQVRNVNVIEGKGFGFVEMSSSTEAENAKNALNDSEFRGRNLKIDEARPPKPRSDRGPGRGPTDYRGGGGGDRDRKPFDKRRQFDRGSGDSGGGRRRFG